MQLFERLLDITYTLVSKGNQKKQSEMAERTWQAMKDTGVGVKLNITVKWIGISMCSLNVMVYNMDLVARVTINYHLFPV